MDDLEKSLEHPDCPMTEYEKTVLTLLKAILDKLEQVRIGQH